MIHQRQLLVAGIAVMLSIGAACAPGKPPQPVIDPFKEQVIVLQKQLLELQTILMETQKKLDGQTELTNSLSTRLLTLQEENRKTAQACSADKPKPTKRAETRKSKKKKTTPSRRQEQ